MSKIANRLLNNLTAPFLTQINYLSIGLVLVILLWPIYAIAYQKNFALIVGIDGYPASHQFPQRETYKDIDYLGSRLADYEYRVSLLHNESATHRNFNIALKHIISKMDTDDSLLVYISGFLSNGKLIPYYVPRSVDDYIVLEEIVHLIDAKTKNYLVVVDAFFLNGTSYLLKDSMNSIIDKNNVLVVEQRQNLNEYPSFLVKELATGLTTVRAAKSRYDVVTIKDLVDYLRDEVLLRYDIQFYSSINSIDVEGSFRLHDSVLPPMASPKTIGGGGGGFGGGGGSSIAYPIFPWPPPRASSTQTVPLKYIKTHDEKKNYLKDVDSTIVQAFEANGYYEKSYYSVPDGFAVVTKLEKIYPDGKPFPTPHRWMAKVVPLRRFAFKTYFEALFIARPGFYRIIVFVVTPHPFSQTKRTIEADVAIGWLSEGLNKLPVDVGNLEFTKEHTCTALIYEFERVEANPQTQVLKPGRLSAITHLLQSNLWHMIAPQN